MSEEEKKALEITKTIIEFAGDSYIPKENRKALQTLLNLIEKQQKEIEELKVKYVRKSKLTPLLKRLKASAWHFDSEKNNIINRLIDSFEELLEEE